MQASRWVPLAIPFLLIIVLPGLFAIDSVQVGSSPETEEKVPKVRERDSDAPYVPGEVLVKFKEGVDPIQVERLAAENNCRVEESIATIQLYRMKILDKRDVWDVAEGFARDPRVEYAEPNFIDHPTRKTPGCATVPEDLP